MKEIQLTKDKVTIVDDEDYEYLSQFKWHVIKPRNHFYAVRKLHIKGKRIPKTIYMHRDILKVIDSNIDVDHKNLDSLDNRKENLRLCNSSQNIGNTTLKSDNKSGYKGVYQMSRYPNKWFAQIRINYKKIVKGPFDTKEQAALIYNELAMKHLGEFANLNKVNL